MDAAILEGVKELAVRAGELILEVYGSSDFGEREKADRSPVTRADIAAHQYLVAELTARYPYPVLSEESPVPFAERRDWESFWLVDPLDGTRDFLARNDEFTVNLALIREGSPVLGVILAPALGELFWAVSGGGAWREAGGTVQRLPRTRCAGKVGARSRFHGGPRVEAFFRANGITQVIPAGSAVKFCRMAEGTVNVYPRFSGSSEWDIAAGHVLLQESGCRLVALDTGEAPRYNKPDLGNPHFLAFSKEFSLADFVLSEAPS